MKEFIFVGISVLGEGHDLGRQPGPAVTEDRHNHVARPSGTGSCLIGTGAPTFGVEPAIIFRGGAS